MRRATVVAVLSLMIVAFGGATVTAHGRGGHPPTATFAARAGTASQGGTFWIGARVQHAARGATFTATAVVHFDDGDVLVTLEPKAERRGHRGHHGLRSGHGRGHTLRAAGQVPVGATQPPGPVAVDVTIRYRHQVVTIATTGLIEGTEPEGPPENYG